MTTTGLAPGASAGPGANASRSAAATGASRCSAVLKAVLSVRPSSTVRREGSLPPAIASTPALRTAAGPSRSITTRDLPGAKRPNRNERIRPTPLASRRPTSWSSWKLTSGSSTITRSGLSSTKAVTGTGRLRSKVRVVTPPDSVTRAATATGASEVTGPRSDGTSAAAMDRGRADAGPGVTSAAATPQTTPSRIGLSGETMARNLRIGRAAGPVDDP